MSAKRRTILWATVIFIMMFFWPTLCADKEVSIGVDYKKMESKILERVRNLPQGFKAVKVIHDRANVIYVIFPIRPVSKHGVLLETLEALRFLKWEPGESFSFVGTPEEARKLIKRSELDIGIYDRGVYVYHDLDSRSNIIIRKKYIRMGGAKGKVTDEERISRVKVPSSGVRSWQTAGWRPKVATVRVSYTLIKPDKISVSVEKLEEKFKE